MQIQPNLSPTPSLEVLQAAAQISPLVWAMYYRRIRERAFEIPAPLAALYIDDAREVVIAKAAQVSVSEWAINLALWAADTRQGGRGNVLYVFPAKEQLGDFTRARVDPAISESAYLRRRVAEPSTGRATDNVGLKRVGPGHVYFRGSNAEAGLLSVDADLVIYDEVDRLKDGALALGRQRLGSSSLAWQRYAGTPMYPELGVDALWLKSDRRHYHLKCESCGERQHLVFPDNVRPDGRVICRACRKPLNRLAAGEWVAEMPGRELHGYHVSKLFSPRSDIADLARTGYAILERRETDLGVIQQFYNQGLGVPHAPEGGQLSRPEIAACIADYSLGEWAPTRCTMGVDVGGMLHVRVNAAGPNGKPRAAYIGTVPAFEDLDKLMARFDVSRCVVDAAPEGHGARKFQARWPGRVFLCNYPAGNSWAYQSPVVWDFGEGTVKAHRTLTLDAMLARIRERRVEYPREVLDIPGYVEQMVAPIRVIEPDARGNQVARYVEGGAQDHYAHAENYEHIAAEGLGLARPVHPPQSTARIG